LADPLERLHALYRCGRIWQTYQPDHPDWSRPLRRRFFFRANNIPAFNRNTDGSITIRRLSTPRDM
jgi:hypothetical protein